MSGPDDYYPNTKAAFMAGQNNGLKLAKQAAEEEAEHEGDSSGGGKLTREEIEGFSAEQHIERRAEVDAFLEEQGK